MGGSNGKIDIHEFISLCSDPEMAGLSWRLRSGFRAVLVIGGPGSGKGILSERLIRCAGIDHVSSGDLLRVEVESGSALGKSCAETMKQGKLLPSSTIMALMKKSMSRSSGHWVALDGFPRSAANCQDFEDVCGKPHCAFYLDVPDDVMVERILNRGQGREDDNLEQPARGSKHSTSKASQRWMRSSVQVCRYTSWMPRSHEGLAATHYVQDPADQGILGIVYERRFF